MEKKQRDLEYREYRGEVRRGEEKGGNRYTRQYRQAQRKRWRAQML